jgi:hypothetical protein
MAKKIRVGMHKTKTNKNGSHSIMERTNKSTWKTVQTVKPIRTK